MAAELLPLELTKAFKDSLLLDEQLRGHYTQKNFVILYDKISPLIAATSAGSHT